MFGAWWAAGHAVAPGVPFAASEHNDLVWPGQPRCAAMAEVADRVDRFYAPPNTLTASTSHTTTPPDDTARSAS